MSSKCSNSGKDIHQRNVEWQQYKEQKIQYIKEKNAYKEVEGCTFVPDISRSEQHISDSDNSFSILGYREFLDRQEKARKIREELERAQAIPTGVLLPKSILIYKVKIGDIRLLSQKSSP